MSKIFRKHLGIFTICMAFLFTGILSLNQMILYTPDSARYLIWANSLSKAEGFKDATTPEPIRYVVHAPLYPIILAPSAVLFPFSVIAAKITTLIVGCFAIFFFYYWLLQRIEKKYALLGSLLLAFNPLTLMFSTQILSDIPFALSMILFFILSKKLVKKRKHGNYDYWLNGVIVAGILLREIGFSLMFAAVIYFIWVKHYRRALETIGVSLFFYLLWFYRNEIVIAHVENPELRNSQLYFAHLFSSSQASIISEFAARFWNNLVAYFGVFGKLLFMPDFAISSNKLVSTTDPLISFSLLMIPVLQYVLMGTTFGLAALGVWEEFKNSKMLIIMGLFLACYFCLILFYPIVDIRFLFPPMIVMLYFFIVGFKWLVAWLKKKVNDNAANVIVASLLLVLMFPNISWIQSFVSNSWQYGQSAEDLYKKFRQDSKYPEVFSNPLHLAAKWIVAHSDSSTIVYCNWKEIALWLDGRKVRLGGPFTPSGQFDSQLRDYRVKYIVAIHWRSVLNECEPLLVSSEKFMFIPAYKVGNVEIFKVLNKKNPLDKKENIKFVSGETMPFQVSGVDSSDIDSLYCKALHFLDDDPRQAEPLFKELITRVKKSTVMEYYLGVTKEFLGQIDSADAIFDKFGSLMQAGAFTGRARQHKEFILKLKEAESASSKYEHNMLLRMLAVNYWSLGYHKQALRILDRLIESDSTFSLAMVNDAIYTFQQGDTVLAKKYLDRARDIEKFNALANTFSSTLQYIDSMQSAVGESRREDLRLKIARSYITMGLYENAVDELQEQLYINPSSPASLQLLGNLYEALRRYEPALRCYKTILTVDPGNREAENKINILNDRF